MELRLKNLKKNYGKQCALKSFDATFTQGIYGLLGPNGAGKTTLISIIIGVLDSDCGEVFLNNTDVRQMGIEYLDKIGYLPQYPIFYKNFYVDEFLRYMCALKAIPKNKVKSRVREVLEFVNLTNAYKKKIGELSGGMRQRLGIAQAILNDPKILILDEPTAGLDLGERIRFRNLISKLSKDRIVLLATHIISDVEFIAKEIIILKKGNLILSGQPSSIKEIMNEKVWNVTVDEKIADELIEGFPVRNVKPLEDKFHLRIVSDKKPHPNAVSVEPDLEDVVLYLFDEREEGHAEADSL